MAKMNSSVLLVFVALLACTFVPHNASAGPMETRLESTTRFYMCQTYDEENKVYIKPGDDVVFVSPHYPLWYGSNEHCNIMFLTTWFASIEVSCDQIDTNSGDPLTFFVDEGYDDYVYKIPNEVLTYDEGYVHAEFHSGLFFNNKGFRCTIKSVFVTDPPTEPATTPTEPATTPTESATTPAAPVETTPAAPVETTPAAPVETTPAAPVETTPAAPVETTPAAPVETTPASGDVSTCEGVKNELIAPGATKVITSPNYPENYNNYDRCEWTLTTEEGYLLSITCDEFDLGDKDWLRVTFKNVLMFKNQNGPNELTFNSRRFFIKFFSNKSDVGPGFKCRVVSYPA